MATALVAVALLVERTTQLEIDLVRESWHSNQLQLLGEKSKAISQRLARPLAPLVEATSVEQLIDWVPTISEVQSVSVLRLDGTEVRPHRGQAADGVLDDARELLDPIRLEPDPAWFFDDNPIYTLPRDPRDRFAMWIRAARTHTEKKRPTSAVSMYLRALGVLDEWADPPSPELVDVWRESALAALESLTTTPDSDLYRTAVAQREERHAAKLRDHTRRLAFEPLAAHVTDSQWIFGGSPDAVIAVRRARFPVKPNEQPCLVVDLNCDIATLASNGATVTYGNEEPNTSEPAIRLANFHGPWSLEFQASDAPGLTELLERGQTMRWTIWGVAGVLLLGFVLLWRAESKRAQLEQLRSDLATNLSHELRTPLSVLRLSAESLANRDLPPEKRQRYLGSLLEETRQLSALVDDVMHLASADRSQRDVDRTVTDLRTIATNIVEAFAPRLDDADFDTILDNAEEELPVRGNSMELSRALSNLIDNALVYAKAGKYLRVTSRKTNRHAVMEVRDHGPGVASPDRHAIFERFRRLENPLTAATSGLGVGLSIAREIIERHGGTIECRDNDSGEAGARFHIQLPLSEDLA